ncbi:hypothetical protein QUB80_34425 [Chlorogloeopsis sp. ULAP01]|nr:hypothetical protein [Chlorogloeopsis sp. ULAP01]MDM9385753.1 hypothetical protein [Chlorogloeopsis sp. ULAP01]
MSLGFTIPDGHGFYRMEKARGSNARNQVEHGNEGFEAVPGGCW